VSLSVGLLVIGDEVLAGRIRDTNGPWLASRLCDLGARVRAIRVVGDDTASIRDALSALVREVDAVLVTGGLGPTDDDGTRAALAETAGRALVEHPGALEAVRQTQAKRGWALDARRRREACLPEGADWVPNVEGTAPGIRMQVGETLVWAMPGVPREMRAMFDGPVVEGLRHKGGLEAPQEAVIRVGGRREPDVATELEDLDGRDGIKLAYYPHDGELEVRFALEAGSPGALQRALAEARTRLGAAVYENRSIEEEVVHRLAARGLSVTTAESLTGGLVARMLTAVPGASDVFFGGWVTYSDRWKHDALGVPTSLLETHGAVSAPVARAMADGARERAKTTTSVALTGVAGPGDGRTPGGEPIPQGTWYAALAFAGRETQVHRHRHPSSRTSVQRRAAVSVLELLRRALGDA
jgi:nicotinamide-nucleotide amidase